MIEYLLNKVNGKLGNIFIDFSKTRIIVWNIPTWNRGQIIFYGGSMLFIYFIFIYIYMIEFEPMTSVS